MKHILELGLPIGGPNHPGGQLFDPITAIVGGIAAGTNLIGGIFKGKAANSAAALQVAAANAAGDELKSTAAQVNPDILSASKAAADTVGEVAARGGQTVVDQSKVASDEAKAAALTANSALDPYRIEGETASRTLTAGLTPGGDFNKTPTLADLQIDPGYAFRLKQGTEALTRSAAAHGGVGGGGFAKDLSDYVQGSASQEYQAAFNRFETSTQNRFANLDAASREGQTASTTVGKNLIDAAQYGNTGMLDATKFAANQNTNATEFGAGLNVNAENLAAKNTLDAAAGDAAYRTQGANAAAGGKIAASNALWSGFTGAANTALGAALSRPSRNYVSYSDPQWNGTP